MTYAALQSLVADYLNRDDLTSVIDDFINNAMHKLERGHFRDKSGRIIRHNFRHMKVKTTLSLTDGTAAYNNPVTNYKELITAQILDSDGVYYPPLIRKEFQYIITIFPDPTNNTGRPLFIGERPTEETSLSPDAAPTHQWYFGPTPDDSYTCELTAYQYSPDLDGSTYTTNWWTQNAWDTLLYGALIEAEPYLQNELRMQLWKEMYIDAVVALIDAEKSEKHSGGHLKIEVPYAYEKSRKFNILTGDYN